MCILEQITWQMWNKKGRRFVYTCVCVSVCICVCTLSVLVEYKMNEWMNAKQTDKETERGNDWIHWNAIYIIYKKKLQMTHGLLWSIHLLPMTEFYYHNKYVYISLVCRFGLNSIKLDDIILYKYILV